MIKSDNATAEVSLIKQDNKTELFGTREWRKRQNTKGGHSSNPRGDYEKSNIEIRKHSRREVNQKIGREGRERGQEIQRGKCKTLLKSNDPARHPNLSLR